MKFCRSHLGALFFPALLLIGVSAATFTTMPPVIEMRTYKIRPGKRQEVIEIFTSRSIPAHRQIGMKILGPFLSIEDPDTFFFMRGFPDLASREPMKSQFYDGPLWKGELEQRVMPLIEKYESVLVEDRVGLFGEWTRAD